MIPPQRGQVESRAACACGDQERGAVSPLEGDEGSLGAAAACSMGEKLTSCCRFCTLETYKADQGARSGPPGATAPLPAGHLTDTPGDVTRGEAPPPLCNKVANQVSPFIADFPFGEGKKDRRYMVSTFTFPAFRGGGFCVDFLGVFRSGLLDISKDFLK